MLQLEKDGSITRLDFGPQFRSRHMIPIDFNPEAQCKKFHENFLNPVMSTEDIDTLQRYEGLILIEGNRAQKILMLLGEGGTGKGTLVRLNGLIIGRHNVAQLRVKELQGRFETSRLLSKKLLVIVEAAYDCLSQDGAEIIKGLVGHDLMEGERKYSNEPLPFDGIYPIIYVSNEDPSIRLSGDESAWGRRLVPLQFPNKRPEASLVIDNFEEILFKEEAEGIFAWMIEGARRHYAELQAGKGFSVTANQERRTEQIIARSKSILTFVLDGLEYLPTASLSSDELYDGYAAFCQDRNWRSFPERAFADIVRPLILQHFGVGKSHDILRTKPNGKDTWVRGYRGLGLKNLKIQAP
jgi:putative DNA primase/helicase